MKKLKLELEIEEGKLAAAKGEYGMFEGMDWDTAVSRFRRGQDSGRKNVAKVATKVDSAAVSGKSSAANNKKNKHGAGSNASLRIKLRGPNVGLARAKEVKVVKKNHWDRLLHPWQRELEAEKREMRKEEARKKSEITELKRHVDTFFESEIQRQLRGADNEKELDDVASKSFESMKSSGSDYWKEHWKAVYEEKIRGDLRHQIEELRKDEEKNHVELVQASPKHSNISGLFREADYETLKRQQQLQKVAAEVQESEKFFQDVLGRNTGVMAWQENGSQDVEQDEDMEDGSEGREEQDSDSNEDGSGNRGDYSESSGGGSEDEEELMWTVSPKLEDRLKREEQLRKFEETVGIGVDGEEMTKMQDSASEGEEDGSANEEEFEDDDGWEWKPKTAEAEGPPNGSINLDLQQLMQPSRDGNAGWEGSDESAEESSGEDSVEWEENNLVATKNQPPTHEQISKSYEAIQSEHKREKHQLEQQLSLEQQRQQAKLMQRRLNGENASKRAGSLLKKDTQESIISREKINAITELQGLMR